MEQKLTSDAFTSRTNALALVEMFSENLPQLICTNPTELELLICGERCPYPHDAPEGGCLSCITRWLRKPFAGDFEFREGRVRVK